MAEGRGSAADVGGRVETYLAVETGAGNVGYAEGEHSLRTVKDGLQEEIGDVASRLWAPYCSCNAAQPRSDMPRLTPPGTCMRTPP